MIELTIRQIWSAVNHEYKTSVGTKSLGLLTIIVALQLLLVVATLSLGGRTVCDMARPLRKIFKPDLYSFLLTKISFYRADNMMANPVGWFEIYVDNIDRAKKFYESVFSVSLERLHSPEIEMWSFPMAMDKFGASGALVHMPGFSPARNSVIIYFSCENCEIEGDKIRQFGGKIEKSKFSIGQYGFIALGYDTEGNMIGLHSMQ